MIADTMYFLKVQNDKRFGHEKDVDSWVIVEGRILGEQRERSKRIAAERAKVLAEGKPDPYEHKSWRGMAC